MIRWITRELVSRFGKCSVLILAIGMSSPTITVSAQEEGCAECTPPLDPYRVEGEYKVCVEPGEFTSGQIEAMRAGGRYWTDPLNARGHDVTLILEEHDVNDGAYCDMKIEAEPLVTSTATAEALGTSNGDGAYIRVKPSLPSGATTEPEWRALFAHEWGHVFGFKNVTNPNCSDKTIMFQYQTFSDIPSPGKCADFNGLANKYYSHQEGGGGEEPQPADGEDYEQCWAVFYVSYTYTLWFNGTWTQSPPEYSYLYTYCEPIIE